MAGRDAVPHGSDPAASHVPLDSLSAAGAALAARPYARRGVPVRDTPIPVLLVDDTIRSRWTVTVAGALLADAGATSVLPLAIHRLP